jgi:hypothetical protein
MLNESDMSRISAMLKSQNIEPIMDECSGAEKHVIVVARGPANFADSGYVRFTFDANGNFLDIEGWEA